MFYLPSDDDTPKIVSIAMKIECAEVLYKIDHKSIVKNTGLVTEEGYKIKLKQTNQYHNPVKLTASSYKHAAAYMQSSWNSPPRSRETCF